MQVTCSERWSVLSSLSFGHSLILNKKGEGLENYETLASRLRPRPRPFCQDQDQDPRLSAQDQDQDLFQVLEAPRDQDHVLEDYSTDIMVNNVANEVKKRNKIY